MTSLHSVVQPLAPRPSTGWKRLPDPPQWATLGFPAAAYEHEGAGLYVISAVEVAVDTDGVDVGPEYHLSITRRGARGPARCSSQEARQALADFGLEGAKEDNHVPHGLARNFWRPVAERLVGIECACTEHEPAIVEDKGDYTWRGVTG